MTMRNALGNSLNIPAFKAAAAVGADKIVADGEEGRLHELVPPDQRNGGCSSGGSYGPAIATGGVGVTLEEMMYGYTVLANGGIMRGQQPFDRPQRRRAQGRPDLDPQGHRRQGPGAATTSSKSRKEERVVGAEYAYLITDILTDPNAQCADLRLRRHLRPGLQGGGEDRHQPSPSTPRARTPARSARPGPSATRRTSSSASGPATPTTRPSSTSSARRSPSGRCATRCLPGTTAASRRPSCVPRASSPAPSACLPA